MLWWSASLALSATVPLLDDDAPVHLAPHFEAGQRARYRQQLHIAVEGPLQRRFDAQQEVEVDVPFVPEEGGAQVRTRTRTLSGVSHVQGAAPVPASSTEHTITWLVDPDGTWRPVQRSGPHSLHQTLGSLPPTAGGFTPPEGSIEVGRTWVVPLDLALDADSPSPDGTAVNTVLMLTGTSQWRFAGWARIAGVRCALLEESQRLTGTSETSPAIGLAQRTGVASHRTSEVCWDPALGAVHWQRASSRTVLHDPASDAVLHMTIRLVTGRIPPRPARPE